MEEINRVISLICLAYSKGGLILVVPYDSLKVSYSEKIKELVGKEIFCPLCKKEHRISKDIIKIYSKQKFENAYKAKFFEIKPVVVFDEVDVAKHNPGYSRTIEDFENFRKDIEEDIKIIKVSTAPNKSLTSLKGEINNYIYINSEKIAECGNAYECKIETSVNPKK